MRRNFKDEGISVCLAGSNATFQISDTKFLQGRENVKTEKIKGKVEISLLK